MIYRFFSCKVLNVMKSLFCPDCLNLLFDSLIALVDLFSVFSDVADDGTLLLEGSNAMLALGLVWVFVGLLGISFLP